MTFDRYRQKAYIKKFIQDSTFCAYCGADLPNKEDKTIDHIIPKINGGKNKLNNFVICCSSCNSNKGNQDIKTILEDPYTKKCFMHYLTTFNFIHHDICYMERVLNTIYPETKRKRILKLKPIQTEPVLYTHYQLKDNYILDFNVNIASVIDCFIDSPNNLTFEDLIKKVNQQKSELSNNLYAINNTTGLLPLFKPYKKGVTINSYYKSIINQIPTKIENEITENDQNQPIKIAFYTIKDVYKVKLRPLQRDIVDFYLENPEFKNFNELSNIFKLSKAKLKKVFTQINKKTGLIIFSPEIDYYQLNPLFSDIKIIKTELKMPV